MELQHNIGMTNDYGPAEGGNAVQIPTHPVIGVAIMYCGKCGRDMMITREGDIRGFRAKCRTCDVTVSVPLMLTNAAVIES